jgi:ketosteroid isomerase-like protein
MNRIVKYCLLGVVLLVSPTWSQTQTAETEKAVAALAHQWLEADMTGNSALLAPLLADEFVDTDPDGKVSGKAEVLAAEKSTKWSSIETSDLKIIVYGDTAIAIGGAKGKGTDASGRPIEFNLRWTDTWVKMPSGKWQCVASHASAVKM